jgi:anaerobic magnesium-protoporphyrin IX monomethyl ester cyclase
MNDSRDTVTNDDLDLVDIRNIPRPDRSLYYKYDFLAENPSKMVIASRGCPYNCTYCYNVELSKCFKTRFWRTRKIEDVIAEVKHLCSNYSTEWIVFPDGTFNASKRWLGAFLTTYARMGLPEFLCNARVENIDEKIAALLKKAGCNRITFGIQSGNEEMRRRVAGRNMSNRQIVEACNICKKYGIRVGVDIIFGWPGETLKQAMDTINLCRKIAVENYSSNVLIYYPGLQITEYAFKKGHIEKYPTLKTINELTPNKSLLVSTITNRLINFDKFFYFLIKFPRLEKVFLLLARLPPNKAFFMLKNLHLLTRSFKYDRPRTKLDLIKNHVRSSLKAVGNNG